MRIVLCYPVESRHCQQISAAMPSAEVVDAGQEGVAEALFSADIYCGHAKVPVDWDRVIAQGRLQWIQSSAAGMDHCLVPSVIESPIPVTSASGVLAEQVAEHTTALVTAWFRSLPVFFRAQQTKEYIRRPTRDFSRSTVGIVGFGGVGRRVARVLAPMAGRILATDVFPVDRPEWVEALWNADRLDDLLEAADVVILSAPLNDLTDGMFGAAQLGKMKPDALLVNVGRGRLLITDDLVSALQSEQIAGAVLDVADPEPLPPEHPLWARPDVIITPHVAGQSVRRIDNMTNFFCENLRRWQEDRPLMNLLTEKRLGFPIRQAGIPGWGEDALDGQPGCPIR